MTTQQSGHVVIVHRWRDRYAHYPSYVDHAGRPVTYVTTALGRESVPASAAEILVLDPAAGDTIRDAVASLARRHGPPVAIIALKEGDLPEVAALRAEYGCAGRHPEDLRRFLDKLEMARRVEAAGLRLPAYAEATDAAAVAAFADRVGWPVIVKPRRGSASSGVRRITSATDLVGFAPERPSIVQEFVDEQIYHVDGVFDGHRLGPWRASRYVNTCLGFTTGDPLGSVEEDDPATLSVIEDFTERMARAMSAEPWIFHLEMFVGEDAAGAPRATFLEVGCRVGGAEIPFIWRDLHGLDLMRIEVALQLGERPAVEPLAGGQPVGGWLLMPSPASAPCLIERSCSLLHLPDGPYAEKVLPAGEIVPASTDAFYEHVGGRFRFRGSTSGQVEAAIRAAAASFDLRCRSLAEPSLMAAAR
ncbi:hypothetical protein F4553_000562 [Allocatelliglobosispora scoriae]|uniref:ATP-grasp domain-containing protein n=1 Tax=Allocatelliglobosispora scoriae TaxID=643052 RepID=A0A841BJH1_9ACTN|nr:ATP-grasp domain-containing protein [Allocatelliglobosispora scoriae]MBB5867183.1 hypothetical protein [Allocatelliglobosispora scoriae]